MRIAHAILYHYTQHSVPHFTWCFLIGFIKSIPFSSSRGFASSCFSEKVTLLVFLSCFFSRLPSMLVNMCSIGSCLVIGGE